MRRCPKCTLTFADSARICRFCGAILDDVPAEPAIEVPSEPADIETGDDDDGEAAVAEPSWACPQCGESVPDTFALCWNCNRQRPDADLDSAPEPHSLSTQLAKPVRATSCSVCGSTRIIPNTAIQDQGQYSSGSLRVSIVGDPKAIIFKDRVYGTLTADICGDCGHVTICVQNPGELYEHYLRSLQ